MLGQSVALVVLPVVFIVGFSLLSGTSLLAADISYRLETERLRVRDAADELQSRLHHLHEGWYNVSSMSVMEKAEIGFAFAQFFCFREVFQVQSYEVRRVACDHMHQYPWVYFAQHLLPRWSQEHELHDVERSSVFRSKMEEVRHVFSGAACKDSLKLSKGQRRLFGELLMLPSNRACASFREFVGWWDNSSHPVAVHVASFVDRLLADKAPCRLCPLQHALVDFVAAFDHGTIPVLRKSKISCL